jgi:hypothetical protein
MKFLISHYLQEHSTESLYFNSILNTVGCKSTIWNDNVSTYDIFDMVKPDICITHYKKVSLDLVSYLQENKNIDLVLNITSITQDNLNILESKLAEFSIVPKFMFSNYYDHGLITKSNIVTILHGADILLSKTPKQYDIDYGIFVDDTNQLKPIGETYHFISDNNKIEEKIDIYLPTYRLTHLYANYNNIVFRYFQHGLKQPFYDAAAVSNKVFFDVSDPTELDAHLNKLLGTKNEKHCDMQNENSGSFKETILSKHTCLNRTKTLLSQFSAKEYIDKLQNIMEGKNNERNVCA